MKLKEYIAANPPKKSGVMCKVCSLPKPMRADVNAALACGDQVAVVWRWLRFDQKQSIALSSVRRHGKKCLKLRRRHR